MSKVHDGFSDRPLLDVSPSDIGLTQATICPVSGKLATEECLHDTNNPPLTDWCAVEKCPLNTVICTAPLCTARIPKCRQGSIAPPNHAMQNALC